MQVPGNGTQIQASPVDVGSIQEQRRLVHSKHQGSCCKMTRVTQDAKHIFFRERFHVHL